MTLRWTLYIIITAIGILGIKAQELPNHRIKKFILTQDTVQIDTSIIAVKSITISSKQKQYLEGIDYFMNYTYGYLISLNIPKNSEIEIQYSIMALDLKKPIQHKSELLINPVYTVTKNPFLYDGNGSSAPLFDRQGLLMSGNIARGISAGNNQNVVVNSNLNLQLSGKVGDMDVVAVISDENNPIQPEGNTQTIQDFDKVFIQLSKNNNSIVVGDFQMQRPTDSYFMNYNKKSRGAQFSVAIPVNKNMTLKAGGEAAISRGRFSRNIINCIEGNQGPYRLTGSNGETYIIIISGTEAVYIDGEKMSRGEQNDYVIDYNSGEITFMPKRIITQYNRIIVEFQYSDRNYARSVFHYNTQVETKKSRLRFNYYTEQDNKNQPFLQTLTDSNKLVLANAGDNLSQAFTSGATPIHEFSKNKILYRKTDSLGYNNVYVFTTEAGIDTVFYEVQFSYTGEGKGNYKLSPTSANGRVFEWIQPIGTSAQGNYEPIIQLVSPKRNQMISVGGDYNISINTHVTAEYAHSIYDKNTYSDIDKTNDGGNAYKLIVSNRTALTANPDNKWFFDTEMNIEKVDKNFRYIERYRNVEFDRTWNRLLTNTTNQDTGYDEQIYNFKGSLSHAHNGSLTYQLGYYNKNKTFTGLQHLVSWNFKFGKTKFSGNSELLTTENKYSTTPTNSNLQAYHLDVNRAVLFFVAGAKYDRERSLFKLNSDSILFGSYGYDQMGFYIKNKDSSHVKYRVEYSQREDLLPLNSALIKSTTGKNISTNLDYLQKNNNRISLTFVYRELVINDTAVIKINPEHTILTRFEYDYGIFKRFVTGNTYFQLGSGNELRRDYQFIEVQPGMGTYVWKDFNDDGKQSTNEFVVASFADKNQANYIKIFLPTNSSVRVNTNQFNQTININPAAVWSNAKDFRKVIAKFSLLTALKLDRKTSDLNSSDFVNPLAFVKDSQIISRNTTFRNTFFFNRSNPTYGADYTYQDNRGKAYLTSGFDNRQKHENSINARWNVNSTNSIIVAYNFGQRLYTSDFYSENNYQYQYTEIKPKYVYQATRTLRLTLVYSYFNGQTLPNYGNQIATNQETGGELRYSIAKAGAINIKYSSYQVAFNGNISSPLGYDMLQGFLVGQNSVWNINFQQMLGGNVQVTFNYDGRKSENRSIIHVGKVEARYLF